MSTIYFFSKGNRKIASSRYRAYFLAEELNRLGYKAKVYPLDFDWKKNNSFFDNIKSFFKYLKLLISLEKSDTCFLQRTIYNKYFFLAVIFARIFFKKEFIFDLDDAIFTHSPIKTFIFVKLAKRVTCGGHFVLDWVKKYNAQSFYFPDAIPSHMYLPYTKNYKTKNTPPIIGWIGDGLVHLENFKLLKPVFDNLIKDNIKFKFRLIGARGDKRIYDFFNGISGLQVEFIDWVDAKDVFREIQKFDIGLMPLRENDLNRAKYAKTIEYMACAVPPIASNFGENNLIIKDRENGFLASTTDEWCEKIKLALSDQKLREKLGRKAQNDIKNKFSIQQVAKQLIKIV